MTVARGALILDAGGILALASGNLTARATLARARNEGRQVAIPAAVLAEVVSDRPDSALVDRVVKSVDEELSLSPQRARQAGILRAKAWSLRQASAARSKYLRPPSAVDAIVMAEAVAAGAAVLLTSDPDDMELLREAAGLTQNEVRIIAV